MPGPTRIRSPGRAASTAAWMVRWSSGTRRVVPLARLTGWGAGPPPPSWPGQETPPPGPLARVIARVPAHHGGGHALAAVPGGVEGAVEAVHPRRVEHDGGRLV